MSQTAVKKLKELDDRYARAKREAEATGGGIDQDGAAQLQRIETRINRIKDELKRNGKLMEFEAEDMNDPKAGQVPLGSISWGGRYKGNLWAITDVNGDIVRGGPSLILKDMATMNQMGALALKAIEDLETLDKQWRAEHDAVRKATSDASSDVKTLGADVKKGQNGALAKRVKGDRDFFTDVNGYIEKLEVAEGLFRKIPGAEKDFEAASFKLNAVVYQYEVDKASDRYKGKEEELEQLKKDIEEAQELFEDVVEFALNIAKRDWMDAAANAISYLGKKEIEAAYEPELNTLKDELEALKKDVKELKDKQFVSAIEGARADLESAAIRLENAQADFKTALEQLARVQANARNELNESSSTKVVGKLIVGRAQQLKAITTAQTACRRYLELSKRGSTRISEIGNNYGYVGTFLTDAAKVDPAFNPTTLYARTLEFSARANVVMLDNWRTWVAHVQGECSKALKWLDVGDKGPMAPFKEAISLVKQGMSA
jgi:hypothetical protein